MATDLLSTRLDVERSLGTFQAGLYEQLIDMPDGDCIHAWKLADDLDRYARIVEATRPELVIETGTRWGGMVAWLTGLGVDVITVDIDPRPSEPAKKLAAKLGLPVEWVTGDSIDPAVIAHVIGLVNGRRVMVSLDSEHAAPHVAVEIEAYGALVTPGCYLVVEDGIFDLATDPGMKRRGGVRIPREGGPLKAISDTLAHDPRWVRDEDIETLTPISHHAAGWWRRVS